MNELSVKTLSAPDLVSLWERCCRLSDIQRTLALASLVVSESQPLDAAALSIGERDRRLFALRRELFGPTLKCLTTCPLCEETLEFRMDIDNDLPAGDRAHSPPLTLKAQSYEVTWRLPTSADLKILSALESPDVNRKKLLTRCVLSARQGEKGVVAEELPEDVIEVIEGAMAEADPCADLNVSLTCPSCSRSWQTPVDIGLFLWREIQAFIVRLFGDVHTLASAYGWSEEFILGLSTERRDAYLRMIRR